MGVGGGDLRANSALLLDVLVLDIVLAVCRTFADVCRRLPMFTLWRPLTARSTPSPPQDLLCECPFWPDDGMCSLKDCSVCECDPKELPKTWGSSEAMDMIEQQSCDGVKHESDVDRDIQEEIKIKLEEMYRNPWLPEEKSDRNVEYTYVNLLRNPERYTGYKGEHANRIWRTIYDQKCFANVSETTEAGDYEAGDLEAGESTNRIFFRIISGIHSSISAHIVKDYLIDEATGTWGPNMAMFQVRILLCCSRYRG